MRTELVQPGKKVASEGPNSSPSTRKEIAKMTETGSSQPCMVGGHSDSAQKLREVLMRESMDAHKSTFHTKVSQAVERVAQRVCAVSVLGDFQDLTRQSLEKVSLKFSIELALRRRLGYRHRKVPSNLNYSVILFCNAQSQNNSRYILSY